MTFDLGPTLLFCPADRPDRYQKAAERADAVIIDLEDAVGPSRKAAGRDALVSNPLDPNTTVVRVNAFDSGYFADDLMALGQTAYRTVMVAKAEDPEYLSGLDRYRIIALCESARGVLAAPALAATKNVAALMWGGEDLVASLGGSSTRFADGSYRHIAQQARSSILLAAGASGKAAIDTIHLDIADLDGLAAEAEDAAAVGFAATACIHPDQVATIRAAYRPSAEQLAFARELLEAAQSQPGVFRFRGQMVDGPVLRHAERVVRMSE
jgi:citrate lyase subunit beta/citryl-CoA lyase